MAKFTLNIEGEQLIYGELAEQQLYFVLHDIQLGAVRTCAPCPEVFTLGELRDTDNSYKYFLNEKWQRFLFGLFVKVAYQRRPEELNEAEYDYMVRKWTNLMSSNKAFTNGTGSWSHHNYIANTNVDALDMAYDKIRTSGGASMMGEKVYNNFGIPNLKVEYFDGKIDPPDYFTIDPYADPRVFFCTNVAGDGTVSRFPQLNGVDAPTPLLGHDVPLAIISEYPVYYLMSRLKKLPLDSSKPSPYIF